MEESVCIYLAYNIITRAKGQFYGNNFHMQGKGPCKIWYALLLIMIKKSFPYESASQTRSKQPEHGERQEERQGARYECLRRVPELPELYHQQYSTSNIDGASWRKDECFGREVGDSKLTGLSKADKNLSSRRSKEIENLRLRNEEEDRDPTSKVIFYCIAILI